MMLYLAIIIFLILVLIWCCRKILFLDKKIKEGMCGVEQERAREKKQNKAKILKYLEIHGKITNRQARRLLGVSKISIVRYMDELEKENLIEQVGKIGKYTKYILKN